MVLLMGYRVGDKKHFPQISFEFLFIKTRPPDKLHNGFRRWIEWQNQIRYVICQGGEFW